METSTAITQELNKVFSPMMHSTFCDAPIFLFLCLYGKPKRGCFSIRRKQAYLFDYEIKMNLNRYPGNGFKLLLREAADTNNKITF